MSQRPGPVCRNMGEWALEGAIKQGPMLETSGF